LQILLTTCHAASERERERERGRNGEATRILRPHKEKMEETTSEKWERRCDKGL
jgi:hypothetical protein